MVHSRFSSVPFQWPAIHFAIAALMAAPLSFAGQRPAAANDYESCARDLVTAGIEAAIAANACGTALRPVDVSTCVTGVVDVADVSALSALSACSRDRRPRELATCVTNIHTALAVTNSSEVLNNCRLSILPERYSSCVVGLSDGAGLELVESLNQCISAGYRPVGLAPTLIPAQ
ncbi:MAG: hypothetical protein ICV77_12265 [Cyanobacteria bacterium Co-bin8]|nr:hypothetical protein [Cyanobacteria bacterium Co-bin8]